MWTFCVNLRVPNLQVNSDWRRFRLSLDKNKFGRNRLFLKSVTMYGEFKNTSVGADTVELRMVGSEDKLSAYAVITNKADLGISQLMGKTPAMNWFMGEIPAHAQHVDIEYRLTNSASTFLHPEYVQFVFYVCI